MSNVLTQLMRASVEGFTNPGGAEAYKPPPAYADALAALFAFILSVSLIALIGLWLWNYSVVPLFEFARPAKSIFQILGLMLFISLIHP